MRSIKAIACGLIMIFFMTNLYAQKPGCKIFHEGKFRTVNQGKELIFTRKGNQQVQYFEKSKVPTIYTIKWINDCTLTLTPGKDQLTKLKGVPANAVLTQKITNISATSYSHVTSANFTKRTITGEIYKIK